MGLGLDCQQLLTSQKERNTAMMWFLVQLHCTDYQGVLPKTKQTWI